MTFEIFDFRKGEVITYEAKYVGGKRTDKISKLSPSPFKSISKANYDVKVTPTGRRRYRFKDGQYDKMSIHLHVVHQAHNAD